MEIYKKKNSEELDVAIGFIVSLKVDDVTFLDECDLFSFFQSSLLPFLLLTNRRNVQVFSFLKFMEVYS